MLTDQGIQLGEPCSWQGVIGTEIKYYQSKGAASNQYLGTSTGIPAVGHSQYWKIIQINTVSFRIRRVKHTV